MPYASLEDRRDNNKAYHKANRVKRCEYQKEYRRVNKEKVAEDQKAWREKNKDKRIAASKEYHENNKAKIRTKCRVYYEKNKAKILAQKAEYYQENKGQISNKHKQWANDNTHKCNANVAKRKAAKLQRTPAWANLDVIAVFFIIARGNSLLTGKKHEVDHIIPLQGELVSGLHVPENLQVITEDENRAKSNKWEP